MSNQETYLFTSESVTEGHPDKMSDQISDAVLDAVLTDDPMGRVACETLVTTGMVMVAGEISTSTYVDFQAVARQTLQEIGYTNAAFGISAENCAVISAIDPQSGDIAQGVDTGGAGDQGLMFGYACRETEELMPLPIMLSHALTRKLAEVRKSRKLDWLRPDGKSQVTVEYNQDGSPRRIHTVVVSTQHGPNIESAALEEAVIAEIIRPTLEGSPLFDGEAIFHVNPTGRFVTGGPQGDCGLTGRKIIVDTYGGVGRHGGGAFSGKDPTKVDRSATYMARHIAKCLVAAEIADSVEVQLAYAIGVAEPVSVKVDSFGTGRIDDRRSEALVRAEFDLTPKGIMDHLNLRRPIYRQTAAYGHFGRTEPGFTWESTAPAQSLRRAAGITGDVTTVSIS